MTRAIAQTLAHADKQLDAFFNSVTSELSYLVTFLTKRITQINARPIIGISPKIGKSPSLKCYDRRFSRSFTHIIR